LVHPTNDLHVLLRHRLLLKPGGFEGFLPSSLEVYADYFCLSELPDDEDRVFRLSAAELALTALMTHGEDAVSAEVLQFLCLDPIVAPMVEDLEHRSSCLLQSLGNEVGWRCSPERDVRCHQLSPCPEVPLGPLGENRPQQLDLLLRHRLLRQ